MRIAIIDDELSEREELKSRLNSLLTQKFTRSEVFLFEFGSDFLDSAKKERFDLIFLDIYLNGESGIDIAEELRTFDKDCVLVFTTTSKDHALEGFRVRALQYLVKPYTDKALTELFEEMIKIFPFQDRYIEINSVKLRFGDILYAEHYQHQIYIYLSDGQKTVFRQTFRDFTSRLDDGRFFLCSRGVIINLEYAEDFDGSAFIMRNGSKITVSRDIARSARQAFGDFLFGRRERQ